MFITYLVVGISFPLAVVVLSSKHPAIVARQTAGSVAFTLPGNPAKVTCDTESKKFPPCCPLPSRYVKVGGNVKCCDASKNTSKCCYLYDGPLGPLSQCCPLGEDILKPPHCCPLPYLAFGGPNQCCYPSEGFNDCCTLPDLPSGKCCMDPGIDKDVPDVDEPQFDLEAPNYMTSNTESLTVRSEFKSCKKAEIIRKTFGSTAGKQDNHGGVPIQWSSFLGISSSFHINTTIGELTEDKFWPEIIIPFIFPILTTLMSLASMIAFLIFGAIGWGILYNVRFVGSKKIRMLIRSLLIRKEKFNRWKYEHSFPRQHLRKLIEHRRYHLPRTFQDSDISSDGEPHELQRPPILRQTETMYTPEEIDLFGYDPDNIPMDWIYGDLFGRPEFLAKEVKRYIKKKRRPSREGDFEGASLNSEEWADFLRNRLTDKMKKQKQTFLTSVRDKVSALESLGNKLMKMRLNQKPSKEGKMADRSTRRQVRK